LSTFHRAVDQRVMHHDEHAVRGRMNVEFEHVNAHLSRILKGFERVFRVKSAAAAMRENERSGSVALKNRPHFGGFSCLHSEVNINPGKNYDHAEKKIAEPF
jgi:hypothetical protein